MRRPNGRKEREARRLTNGPWVTTKEQAAHMKEMQAKNIVQSDRSRAEAWMWEKLRTTGLSWKRQRIWGYRIYDFWCHVKGVAIEVDGAEHRPAWDAKRDKQDWDRSCVIVLRVRNFNEEDAKAVLERIAVINEWKERKAEKDRLEVEAKCISGQTEPAWGIPGLEGGPT